METGPGLLEPLTDFEKRPIPGPRLLVELPSWPGVFRRNLADLLRPHREPPLRLASKPASFWPDVFVQSHVPWRSFCESAFYHALALLMMWAATLIWSRQPRIEARRTFSHEDVIYYQPSELLPPLDTGGLQPQPSLRGEPAYAPQPILSVPREADNRRQTIVTPPNLKLDHDVPLPNVVSWSKAPPAVPIAAAERKVLSKAAALETAVVEPPPELNAASSRNTTQNPESDVIQPSPVVDAASRRPGEMNIAPAPAIAPAPQLAVEAQRASVTRNTMGGAAPVVPPPPSASEVGASNSGGRLIALSVHPAAASAPVDPPPGNRLGSFSATPQGKAGAAGTPDVAGTGKNSGTGSRTGISSGVPAGLYVGAGPDPKTSVIGGNGQGIGNGSLGPASGQGSSAGDSVLMAKVTPPRVTSSPHRQAEAAAGNAESEVEKKVFGDRKFYSMTLNMPNLNSAGGSWIIHFAEQGEEQSKSEGALAAPTVTAVSDPAYPLELMKQHVQGTVTLYAVIGTDGAVSNVRVLNGIDDRLDQYACEALGRWHFRPASKNGNPVALEAVVKIPFHPVKMRPSF
jgi:TonB family protein